jgi:hypothetical protein
MPNPTPQDWEILERELHAAGVSQLRSRQERAGCLPRPGGISSPRHASSSALHKEISPWLWA